MPSNSFMLSPLHHIPMICPLCPSSSDTDTTLRQRAAQQWQCDAGHHFDVAKQGYLNLLPAHFKRSKDPGDSKAMVQARRRFLTSEQYRPIVQQLVTLIRQYVHGSTPKVLDAGCGEGYYLRTIAALCEQGDLQPTLTPTLAGNDVSKWAVQAAAPWHKSGHYVVASNARLPFADASFDIVICAFGFIAADEFKRVLKVGGVLITLDPDAEHLKALRELLYNEVNVKAAVDHQLANFSQVDEGVLTFAMDLPQTQLKDLIAMTPHAHRAPSDGLARAAEVKSLAVGAAIRWRVFQSTASPTHCQQEEPE